MSATIERLPIPASSEPKAFRLTLELSESEVRDLYARVANFLAPCNPTNVVMDIYHAITSVGIYNGIYPEGISEWKIQGDGEFK